MTPPLPRQGRVLDDLLGPVGTADFFASHWQRRSVHVQGDRGRFAGLISRAQLVEAARRSQRVKSRTSDARGWPVETAIPPEAVESAFGSGATVCLQVIEGVPAMDRLRAGLAAELLHAGEPCFNLYWSPDAKGFGLHLDDHPVFILQVEGRKRWRYSATPGLSQPLETVTFPPGVPAVSMPWGVVPRPDESSFVESVLAPGDLLYLPQGTWHEASAIGESLALTLAIDRATPVDLVQRTVGAWIAQHPQLRHNLPGFPAHTAAATEMPAELRESFESTLGRLRGLVDSLTPEDLYRCWRDLALRHGKPE